MLGRLRKRWGWELLIWVAILGVVYGFTQWRGAAGRVPRQLPPLTVQSLDGQLQPLALHAGQMTLLNFWSPDCPPCLAEIPALNTLQHGLGGAHFRIVGIAVNGSTAAGVAARQRQLGIAYPLYLDGGEGAAQALGGVVLTPTSLLVNGQGQIVGRYVGAISLPVIVFRVLWERVS